MNNKAPEKRKGGWTTKPFLEQKVMVYHTVKRKYHRQAMEAIKELCKQWR